MFQAHDPANTVSETPGVASDNWRSRDLREEERGSRAKRPVGADTCLSHARGKYHNREDFGVRQRGPAPARALITALLAKYARND